MENKPTVSQTFNYLDIFFSYYSNDDTRCVSMSRDHSLVYVYSGEMLLEEKGREITIRKGECAFIRRDNRVVMTKRPFGEEQYQGIFMAFKRNFLRDFYNKMDRTEIPDNVPAFATSVIKLPQLPEVDSLFNSMTPYFDSAIKPKEELMQLKLVEGVRMLLGIDRRFYPALFDFTEPWKIDILEFMEQNYRYDLSMEEIASFTGRSLATFKRDFKKVSELTPQKWIMEKRLKEAHFLLQQSKRKVIEVCEEVGFKNLSHFSTAFKRRYGYSPTK